MTVTTGPDVGATQTVNTDINGVSNFTLNSGGTPGTDALEFSAATLPAATICNASQSFYTNATIVINETDADTPSTDVAEFVELYDGGLGNTLLDGLSVIFWNGGDSKAYASFDLAGKSTNAQGYFVIGNVAITTTLTGSGNFTAGNVSTMPNNTLQNGADAVGLDAAAFADAATTELPMSADSYGFELIKGAACVWHDRLSKAGDESAQQTLATDIERTIEASRGTDFERAADLILIPLLDTVSGRQPSVENDYTGCPGWATAG